MKMIFDHTLALYGPLLILLCIMSLIEIISMYEIGYLAISDSEMRIVMRWVTRWCLDFSVFAWACSKSDGQWVWQVIWWFCEGGHLYAYKWPLCQNWHAIGDSCSPCFAECPHVCGINDEHVFDVQNAFLVVLDTLWKTDPLLMKTRGKHDWYTQMWCGWCAWQVGMLTCHFLYGGHLHACKWPHRHMSILILPTCCPYWCVPLVKFLC